MHDSQIIGSFRDLAYSYSYGPPIAQAFWVQVVPAHNDFHLAPGLPYRVAMTGDRDKPPAGRVSSVDAATAAKIVVTT